VPGLLLLEVLAVVELVKLGDAFPLGVLALVGLVMLGSLPKIIAAVKAREALLQLTT